MEKAKQKRKGLVRLLIGGAAGFLLLAWLLYKADIHEVMTSIQGLSPWPILLMVLINYLSIPLRVFQWRFLLGNPTGLSFAPVFRALCVGYLGNALLPMGGGEVLKAYVLSRSSNLGFARTLISVILIRLQDLLPILLMTTATLGILPLTEDVEEDLQALLPAAVNIPMGGLRVGLRVFAIGSLTVTACIVLGLLYRETARRHVVAALRIVSGRLAGRCDRILDRVNVAIDALGTTRFFLMGQGCAFGCWAVFVITPLPLLLAFSMDFYRACVTALAINGLVTLAQLLPIAPAAVGTYHAACVFTLLAFNPGMNRETAVAYALVSHLVATMSPVLLALPFLPAAWEELRGLGNARQKAKEFTESS
jgi:uncharacterized protein (TIRG00374 family)